MRWRWRYGRGGTRISAAWSIIRIMPRLVLSRGIGNWPAGEGFPACFLGLTFCWCVASVRRVPWKETVMDATVEQLGGVVIDALRAAGYLESTIGQYQKTIRYLKGFVADRGEVVYTPWLGAEFAAMTTSPRTGRFSAERRFAYRRLVTLFDGFLATGVVDLSVRGRGGGGARPVSDGFTAMDIAWEADMEAR